MGYGQTLHFFDAEAIGTSVFFEDLGQTLNDGGLDDVLTHLRRLITDRRPGMIAIDSFKALSAYAATPRAFRHFLHELAGVLTAVPTTTFWVGEYGRDEIATAARSRTVRLRAYLLVAEQKQGASCFR